MGLGLRALMAAVVLGGAFGSATASVDAIDQGVMMVEIEVEVIGTAESVVAHFTFEEEGFTLPLLDRGDGIYGLRTELEAKNYAVVFETVGEDGERSDPTTLAQMGADVVPQVGGTTSTAPGEGGLSEESARLLWLAVALAAASLSLLAFWVLGSRDDEDGDEDGADNSETEPEAAGEEE